MSITRVPGIRVGHWTDLEAATGCTVILCEPAAQAGSTFAARHRPRARPSCLRPGSLVGKVNAIVLSGGSAFGLDAATGVMRYLEERKVGFSTDAGPVPIVPAAALFDLALGRADVRPDAAAGYAACQAAPRTSKRAALAPAPAPRWPSWAGPGRDQERDRHRLDACSRTARIVAALLAVNAVGAMYDPRTGEPLAEPRTTERRRPARGDQHHHRRGRHDRATRCGRRQSPGHDRPRWPRAHDSARAHQYDGDTLFALSLPRDGAQPVELLLLGQAAVDVVAEAVVRAIRAATPLHGVPAAHA